MRLSWDQFAKEVIPTLLSGVGRVESAVEVRLDAQIADLVVLPEPNVNWEEAFDALGWLARMAEQECLIEPFSKTIAVEQARDCLRKQLNLHHLRRTKENGARLPKLWLLSTGNARTVTECFALSPRCGWPQGFRFSIPALELCVVVLSELPEERATLPLRLLGRGRTLHAALKEVQGLPESDPMRRPITEVLVRERFIALDSSYAAEEKAMLEEKFQSFLQGVREEARKQAFDEARKQAFDEARKQAFDEARKQLSEEGREAGRRLLVRQLEKRFGPLESAVLERIATADEAALDGYADRVLDAASVGEVIGE